MYVCMYVCVYAFMYAYVFMYIYIYMCVCVQLESPDLSNPLSHWRLHIDVLLPLSHFLSLVYMLMF